MPVDALEKLEHDADAHLDAWFNQGNSIARGPRAPKDAQATGTQQSEQIGLEIGGTYSDEPLVVSVVNHNPPASIRELVAKHGLKQPSPAGHNRPMDAVKESARLDAPEVPRFFAPAQQSYDDEIAQMEAKIEAIKEQKRLEAIARQKAQQEQERKVKAAPAGAGDLQIAAVLGLLSAYMPADEYEANPVIQRINRMVWGE